MKHSKRYDYLSILIGTLIVGFGINWFLAPFGIVTGGISGIGIILRATSQALIGFEIPLWLTNIVLNIPLFSISIKQRGLGFAKKSMFAVLSLSLWLSLIEYLPNPFLATQDLLVAGLFGGALAGIGIGLVLRSGASTGGTDMLAAIIRFRHPRFPIAQLMMGIDSAILIAGLFTFGVNMAVYAILAVLVSTRMVTTVLEGMHYAKAVYILSAYNESMSREIMEKLPRGVTALAARGVYTNKTQEMLFVVVSQKQISTLRTLIYAIDPKAFVVITDVKEVLGQGFIEDYNALM